MIALADCNNFFASCERSLRPELEGKPIIVLSNNDGCIIARSNEVKALGYKMGEPVFKVKDQLLRDKVHVFSANVTLYRAISQKNNANISFRMQRHGSLFYRRGFYGFYRCCLSR